MFSVQSRWTSGLMMCLKHSDRRQTGKLDGAGVHECICCRLWVSLRKPVMRFLHILLP